MHQRLIETAQRKNYGNLLSHYYWHNYCEINFIIKKNRFDKTFIRCVEQSVEKTRNLSLKKISSNQLFINFFSKTIAFTKFLGEKSVRENFEYFCKFTNFCFTLEIFRENEFRDFNAFRKSLLPRNFCQQCV